MKHDLKQVTFNIPVKIDSAERLANLELVVAYLRHHFDTNIIIYEAYDISQRVVNMPEGVTVIAENIGSKPFHRTRYLNQMAILSRTPIIVNYDCDVVFPVNSYLEAAKILEDPKIPAVLPYSGLFVNVLRTHYKQIRETFDVGFIDVKKSENFGTNSVGGAIFWNRVSFIRCGMENENFISWGYEDWERVKRVDIFGGKIPRLPYPLYHISHPRGNDSSDRNPYYKQNGVEYEKVTKMDSGTLFAYVRSQPWMQHLSWT